MDTDVQTINNMKKILKSGGYKLAAQQTAILEVLCQNKERHLSLKEIYRLSKHYSPKISLTTVYKTVLLFEKAGLLYPISIYGYFIRYQLIPSGKENIHRHFICTRCGKVTEIAPREFTELKLRLKALHGISIDCHDIYYYGICRECEHSKDAKGQKRKR